MFLSRVVCAVLAVAARTAAVPAWAEGASPPAETAPVRKGEAVVAVLPPESLSGSPSPLREIRRALREALEARSVGVLDEGALDAFLASRRIRYTGGLASETGSALLAETGATAALVTSVDLFEDSESPKLSITSRLVSTGERSEILWMDSVAVAAGETRGLFELRLVRDVKILADRAIAELSDALAGRVAGAGAVEAGNRRSAKRAERRFRPRAFHRAPGPARDRERIRVAVMPFRNDTGRQDAGDLVSLQFVRYLAARPNVDLIEPGVVREVLLRARLVQADGISLPQADLLREFLDADLVVTGRVLEWQDAPGEGATPRVAFSAQGIETRGRRVAWSATTGHRGDRAVFFFESGRVFTANALAAEMVLAVVERALERDAGGAR